MQNISSIAVSLWQILLRLVSLRRLGSSVCSSISGCALGHLCTSKVSAMLRQPAAAPASVPVMNAVSCNVPGCSRRARQGFPCCCFTCTCTSGAEHHEHCVEEVRIRPPAAGDQIIPLNIHGGPSHLQKQNHVAMHPNIRFGPQTWAHYVFCDCSLNWQDESHKIPTPHCRSMVSLPHRISMSSSIQSDSQPELTEHLPQLLPLLAEAQELVRRFDLQIERRWREFLAATDDLTDRSTRAARLDRMTRILVLQGYHANPPSCPTTHSLIQPVLDRNPRYWLPDDVHVRITGGTVSGRPASAWPEDIQRVTMAWQNINPNTSISGRPPGDLSLPALGFW
jgi:hypothetical protein